MDIRKRLKLLEFSPTDGPEPLKHIEKLEKRIGVPLPPDYRKFLLEIGGGYVTDTVVPCSVPTPFAEHNLTTIHTVQEVLELLDSSITPRNMICITYGHFGMTGCLSVAGLDHGQVYALDTEMKFFWDAETISRFPNLDPGIKEFFRLRDADELPEGPWGYNNCYHLADSFTEFLQKMRLASDSSSQKAPKPKSKKSVRQTRKKPD